MSLDYERRLLAGIKYATIFFDEKISFETIYKVLDVARWAPSYGNIQPWEIIVVDDSILIKKIAPLAPYGRRIHRASALLFIVTDPTLAPDTHIADGGSLASYIMLSASIHGLSVFSIYLNNNPVLRSILGIPPNKFLHTLIALGKSVERRPLRQPKTLNMILYRNRYGIRVWR